MDDRRALMAAIIANPDEDTPRLALADWLQEHGDKHDQARAEFIRLQIQAAKLPEGAERKKLDQSAIKLEKKHGEAWIAPIKAVGGATLSFPGVAPKASGFNQGLLSYVFYSPGDFFLKAIHSALPDALAAVGVEGLYFFSGTKRIADLTASPALKWAIEFQYPGADDATLGAFAKAPNFAHLRKLEFGELRATDAGLHTFSKTTGTTRLRELTLTSNDSLDNIRSKITAAGVLALLHSDRLPLLDSLEVEGAPGAKFAMPTFLADAGLAKLRKLTLHNRVTLADIIACPHLANLHKLELVDTSITAADTDALLASPAFANLRELWLGLRTEPAPTIEKKLKARFGDGLQLDVD